MIPANGPYEDELLSSALTRCCRAFRLPFKRLASVVLQRPGARDGFLTIPPLDAMQALFAQPAERLLWEHTAFPYATSVASQAVFESALQGALGRGGGLGALLGVMHNAFEGQTNRLFCRDCVKSELSLYGESFWHCSHNLPGVTACRLHRCRLTTTAWPSIRFHTTIYAMPHEFKGRYRMSSAPSEAEVLLAERSRDLQCREWGPGRPQTAAEYRDFAVNNGWLSAGRDVSGPALLDVVRSTFAPQALSRWGLFAKDWPALAFRPSNPFSLTPLRHLLLQVTLSTSKPERPGVLDHIPAGYQGTAARKLDAFYAPRVHAELQRALKAGDRLTTREFLCRIGAYAVYRHRKDELPALRAAVREFRSSAASVKPLGVNKSLFRKLASAQAAQQATTIAA